MKCVGYNVGQTCYSSDQIMRLSRAIIAVMKEKGIGEYDYLENSRQHYALNLVRHIVMTQRDPRAVGGTRLAIAQWSAGAPGFTLKPSCIIGNEISGCPPACTVWLPNNCAQSSICCVNVHGKGYQCCCPKFWTQSTVSCYSELMNLSNEVPRGY